MSLPFLRLHDIITDWYWRMVDRRLLKTSGATSTEDGGTLRRVPSHIAETVDPRKGFEVGIARVENCSDSGFQPKIKPCLPPRPRNVV